MPSSAIRVAAGARAARRLDARHVVRARGDRLGRRDGDGREFRVIREIVVAVADRVRLPELRVRIEVVEVVGGDRQAEGRDAGRRVRDTGTEEVEAFAVGLRQVSVTATFDAHGSLFATVVPSVGTDATCDRERHAGQHRLGAEMPRSSQSLSLAVGHVVDAEAALATPAIGGTAMATRVSDARMAASRRRRGTRCIETSSAAVMGRQPSASGAAADLCAAVRTLGTGRRHGCGDSRLHHAARVDQRQRLRSRRGAPGHHRRRSSRRRDPAGR